MLRFEAPGSSVSKPQLQDYTDRRPTPYHPRNPSISSLPSWVITPLRDHIHIVPNDRLYVIVPKTERVSRGLARTGTERG